MDILKGVPAYGRIIEVCSLRPVGHYDLFRSIIRPHGGLIIVEAAAYIIKGLHVR